MSTHESKWEIRYLTDALNTNARRIALVNLADCGRAIEFPGNQILRGFVGLPAMTPPLPYATANPTMAIMLPPNVSYGDDEPRDIREGLIHAVTAYGQQLRTYCFSQVGEAHSEPEVWGAETDSCQTAVFFDAGFEQPFEPGGRLPQVLAELGFQLSADVPYFFSGVKWSELTFALERGLLVSDRYDEVLVLAGTDPLYVRGFKLPRP